MKGPEGGRCGFMRIEERVVDEERSCWDCVLGCCIETHMLVVSDLRFSFEFPFVGDLGR